MALPLPLARRLQKCADLLAPPSGFGWAPPIYVWDNAGTIYTNFDVADFKPPGTKTYYVDSVTGNAANDGLTPATALVSLKAALQKADVDIVRISGGPYNRLDGVYGNTCTRSVSVIGDGDVIVGCWFEPLSWTKTDGYTNVYGVVRSAVGGVLDSSVLDANGMYTKYTLAESVEAVDATEGSYYIGDGNAVSIHCLGHGAPGATVHVLMADTAITVTGDRAVYFENIQFYGGTLPFVLTGGADLYAKGCAFAYGTAGNGLAVLGESTVYLQGCEAFGNALDGFNYHHSAGALPSVIEVDCKGHDNGTAAAHTYNGSTCHDGGHILRVNGEYYRNHGPNVVDVSDGTRSWNIGCYAHDSTDNSANCVDFMTTTGAPIMWLHRCVGGGSTSQLVSNAPAAAYTYLCTLAVATGAITDGAF